MHPSHAYWFGVLTMPRAWVHKGESLRQAFALVAEGSEVERTLDFDVHEQALMLAGMACEALLKALAVSRPVVREAVMNTESFHAPATLLGKDFFTHDLPRLARLADVALSPSQSEHARTLTEFIVWRGRYMMPKEGSIRELLPRLGPDGLHTQPHASMTIDDARSLLESIVIVVRARIFPELTVEAGRPASA